MQQNDVLVIQHQHEELTLDVLATRAGVHPGLAQRFVEFGLVHSVRQENQVLYFDVADIPRLRMINRLREVLGINLAGVEVVLNLLDKIHALQRENESLRCRL
jgi:MerR family transcriptional regulator/heat shock protein HspR